MYVGYYVLDNEQWRLELVEQVKWKVKFWLVCSNLYK